MVINDDKVESLISELFNDINTVSTDDYSTYISNQAILTPKNDDVDDINEKILNTLPGEGTEFLSANSVVNDDQEIQIYFPIEFLNTLTPSGTPPHKLVLKISALLFF